MFEKITPSQWAEIIGGLFIFIYFLIQVIEKTINHTKWGKERKQEKDKEKEKQAHEQYKRFTNDFVESFVPPLIKQFTEQDEKLLEKLDKLTQSSNDLLRKDMTDIYYKYLPYRKILQYDKESFLKLYHDYAAQGGNTYITDVYNELKDWEVVLREEDLHW